MIDSSDGVRIVLHDLGGPSGGVPGTPVLLFSHATGFHGRVWEPMASLLADQTSLPWPDEFPRKIKREKELDLT